MRHRDCGAEMSEVAVPGSSGSEAGGGPAAAALIFSTSLLSKSFFTPGLPQEAAYQGETAAGE